MRPQVLVLATSDKPEGRTTGASTAPSTTRNRSGSSPSASSTTAVRRPTPTRPATSSSTSRWQTAAARALKGREARSLALFFLLAAERVCSRLEALPEEGARLINDLMDLFASIEVVLERDGPLGS